MSNISSDGVEKGILLKFKHKFENTYKSELFDLKTVYTKEAIDKWIVDKTTQWDPINYELDTTYYWKVNNYSLKECGFNKIEWEEIYKYSNQLWNRVIEERLLSDSEILTKYDKLKAIDNNVSNNKRKSTNYEERNLEKKSKKNQQVIYKF